MNEVLDDLVTQERTPDVHTASLFDGAPARTADDSGAAAASMHVEAGFTPIVPVDVAEIREGRAVVSYAATEAMLAELRTLYEGKRYDLSLPAEAEAARIGSTKLMKLRTGLEKLRKSHKAPAIELGTKIDAEAERLRLAIVALEKPIDDQIEAEKKRLAEEESRRAREAEERRIKFEADIAAIRAYADHAKGLPSDRILKGIAIVEAMEFGAEWAEFGSAAALAQAETMKGLHELLAAAQAKEAAEAAAAAERARLEQVAAEQRAEADRLASVQAELDAKKADLERRLAAFEAAERAQAEAAAQVLRDAETARQRQEDDDIARIWEAARRIEGNRMGYVLKAQGYFESGAGAHFADDERPRIVAALQDARAEMQEKLRLAQEREESDRLAEVQRQADVDAKAQADAEAAEQAELDRVERETQAKVQADSQAANDAAAQSMADEDARVQALLDEVVPTPGVESTDMSNERIAELAGGQIGAVADVQVAFSEPTATVVSMPITFAEPPAPAPAADAPPITIGTINDRLGFTLTARFLESLGFVPTVCKAPGTRFAAADWPLIKGALLTHIEGLR